MVSIKITYKIDDNKLMFFINEKIYSLTAVMKTAYMFIDKVYIYLDYESENIIKVQFTFKEVYDKSNMGKTVNEFCNELLSQCLRIKIFKDTKNIRELILGRALYNTCIENDKGSQLSDECSYYKLNKDYKFECEDELHIGNEWKKSEEK